MTAIFDISRGLRLGLAALASTLAFACAGPAPASQQAQSIDAGQLFQQACAKCHGSDGSGGLAMAVNGPKPIDLRDATWQASRTDEEIAVAIRDGRGAMPPFRDVLNGEQVDALARHVRSLRPPSP